LRIKRDRLPRVDDLLATSAGPLPRRERLETARRVLDRARGEPETASPEEITARFDAELTARLRRRLQPVINATGILLHTNLGRAPVDTPPIGGYASIELDLSDGRRGGRGASLREALAQSCGAEDALVVNNGAAALLLALTTAAAGRDVIVSRGELVEIGGSFRIPDVVEACGARIVEVGTTNRTRVADYADAIGEHTAALLKVHMSNYRIVGFTAQAEIAELARLGPPVIADLGSGLLDTAASWLPTPLPVWLRGEPGARQALGAGAEAVVFSGDKLLGGPQAGIVAGDAAFVGACARHPLARALRPGKLVLSSLMATIDAYLDGDVARIPFWRMALASTDELAARAAAVAARCPGASVVEMHSAPGGGSTPGMTIPSVGLAVRDPRGGAARALRQREVPVIGRVEGGLLLLDLRTVDPCHDDLIAAALLDLHHGLPE
jgi:L-seryl-tRNA(Ser) seleniumtransferase